MLKTPGKPGFASINARFRGPGEPHGDPPTSEIPGKNRHPAHEKVAQSADYADVMFRMGGYAGSLIRRLKEYPLSVLLDQAVEQAASGAEAEHGEDEGLVWLRKSEWVKIADCSWRTFKQNLQAQDVPVQETHQRAGIPFSRLPPHMKAEINRR
jgi:hypothetical protein